jgi:hypothetical protein
MALLIAAAPPGLAAAMAILVIVIASDAWVYSDAKRQRDAGQPVVLTIGNFRIDTPEAWLVACVVFWIIAFPLYLTGRRQ